MVYNTNGYFKRDGQPVDLPVAGTCSLPSQKQRLKCGTRCCVSLGDLGSQRDQRFMADTWGNQQTWSVVWYTHI